MDPAQYQSLLQGLEQATASELVQPVLDEKEDDFGALAQENLEGMGTFLLGHSGSQILGGVNKALGITKKAGLSEEAQKEFAEAIKEGDFGKVFQKLTKFGLKRVGNTLQEKGEDILKQVRGTPQEVETPPVEITEGADTEELSQISDGNQARANIPLKERQQLQEESRARSSKINQDLDKQDQELSDLTDQLSKNQGDVEAALKKLSTTAEPEITELTGPTVGEEGTRTLGRLTELGEGGGRISNAFDLVRRPTIFKPGPNLEDLVNNAGLENNAGAMGSLFRTNPLFNASIDNEADTAARNLALSARNALSSSITARPNIPNLPSGPPVDSTPTAEEAGQAAREALGNLASKSEKIASDASEAAQKALSGLTKSEDVVKALKTATEASAEEDFDPVNIALTGALGLASVLGGLFVKTKSEEDISRDINPVNFGVQIGGS